MMINTSYQFANWYYWFSATTWSFNDQNLMNIWDWSGKPIVPSPLLFPTIL